MTGPLSNVPPATFGAGPLGTIDLNGFLSGTFMAQNHHVHGDKSTQEAISSGQAILQKTDGWWQFYIQAGAYDIMSLGTPFAATDEDVSNLYGPVPVAYLKLQPGKNTSVEIGALPTVMGAEYTFSFQNMNINRGLLWNQENAVNRGIQVNQTIGHFTAALSWNDGYYSNRYSWVSGSLTYVSGPHSLALAAMGNLGQTAFQTIATPVQNNGSMYAVIYTYSKSPWIIQPYYQYGSVPTNAKIGIAKGNTTQGGAVLLSHTFQHGFPLPARWEYITSTGSSSQNAVNLMYGPGSAATSFTVTPTLQRGGFFARGDLAVVHARNYTPGLVFGPKGLNGNQTRAVLEVGFIFGNNL